MSVNDKSYRQHGDGYAPDRRGNSTDRRRRKEWLLLVHGNGTSCPCTHCGRRLTFRTLEVDRITPGGSYARDNIQPACRRCNAQRSDNPRWLSPLAAAALNQ